MINHEIEETTRTTENLEDFWGESGPQDPQAWEAWSGVQPQQRSEQQDVPAQSSEEELELPQPQQTSENTRGWASRVKRLGSFMLRRRAQHDQTTSPDSNALIAEINEHDVATPEEPILAEQPVADTKPAVKQEEPDFWTLPPQNRRSAAQPEEPAAQHETELPAPVAEHIAKPASVERFERQGYVKETPYLSDQALDTLRTNIVRYIPEQSRRVSHAEPENDTSNTVRSISEHEGLVALKDFLDTASTQDLKVNGRNLSEAAHIISTKLSFIGEKEFAEATQGIKELWKNYLDTDPQGVLHIVAGVSAVRETRKSDQYVAEQILNNFSDEELAAYAGRIKLGVRNVTSDPAHTKIVLVDDWTMSGSQLRTAAGELLYNDPKLDAYQQGFEVNMLAASDFWIQRGLTEIYSRRGSSNIPIKAYYKTHDFSPQTASARVLFKDIRNSSPLTGTHSSGDFGFENIIHDIVKAQKAQGKSAEMPPLTNIVREYPRYASPIYIKDGAVHKY